MILVLNVSYYVIVLSFRDTLHSLEKPITYGFFLYTQLVKHISGPVFLSIVLSAGTKLELF